MDIILAKPCSQSNIDCNLQTTQGLQQHGLSLLELVIILAILSVTLVAGTPKLFGLVASNRLAVQMNQLHGTINYAKMESATRNRIVLVCPTRDNQTCLSNQDWSQGWMVFVDNNDDRELDEDDAILRVFQPTTDISIQYSGVGPKRYIPFFPIDGMRTNGSFLFCAAGHPELNRALIVSKARPRVSTTTTKGKPIKCEV